jgi:hypothetical protein
MYIFCTICAVDKAAAITNYPSVFTYLKQSKPRALRNKLSLTVFNPHKLNCGNFQPLSNN